MRRFAPSALSLCLALAASIPARAQDGALPADGLPAGWKAQAPVEVDEASRARNAAQLGVRIDSYKLQSVSVRGLTAQLHVLRCPDEKSALALHRTMSEALGSGVVFRKGTTVVRAGNCQVLMAKKIRDLLGWTPAEERIWEVQMRIGCVDRDDAAKANVVYNLFLEGGDEPPIRALTKDWTFGTAVRLWTGTRPWFHAEYDFAQASAGKAEAGGVTTFRFREPARQCGIPFIDVQAVIGVRNAYRPAGVPQAGDLCAATPRWPVEKVRDLAGRVIGGAKTPEQRVEALLAYVFSDIKFDGPVTGSRFGVEQVLAQKSGHCWDKSDVFVTLCRAAGIPARQIAGWVPLLRSGHVWSEVYLEGQGWLPVDATAPWTGTSDDYVPWFSTSDGEMPAVYLSSPILRIKG